MRNKYYPNTRKCTYNTGTSKTHSNYINSKQANEFI